MLNFAATLFASGLAMRFRTLQAAPLIQLPAFLIIMTAPVYVPRDLIEGWVGSVASVNPMTAVLEAGRNLIIGAPAETLLALGVAAGADRGDDQLGAHRAAPGRSRGLDSRAACRLSPRSEVRLGRPGGRGVGVTSTQRYEHGVHCSAHSLHPCRGACGRPRPRRGRARGRRDHAELECAHGGRRAGRPARRDAVGVELPRDRAAACETRRRRRTPRWPGFPRSGSTYSILSSGTRRWPTTPRPPSRA